MTPILSVTQDQTALRRVSAPGQLARQKRQTETAIRRGEFLPYLQCIVDAHSQLTLEITEDCAAWDQARAVDNMARCKQLGFSIYAAPLPLDQAEIYFRAYSAGLAFS